MGKRIFVLTVTFLVVGVSVGAALTRGRERVVKTAYMTGYAFYDNTPSGDEISDPVVHARAGGTGTYRDPITVAVGHAIVGGQDKLDYPRGTRVYVPNVRRYFVVEDTCGDGPQPQNGPCHAGRPRGTTVWIDLWVDGRDSTPPSVDSCMAAITRGPGTIVFNPRSNYAVSRGPLIKHGRCTKVFGDALVKSKK